MGITFGGYPCEDPQLLHRSFVDRDWAAPWLGRVNHFVVPLGKEPGSGLIILRWENLQKLLPAVTANGTGSNSPVPSYTLDFNDERGGDVPLLKISIKSYDALTPGAEGDPDTAYKVELVDKRHFIKAPTNRAFNVSSCDGTEYLTATKSGSGSGSTAVPWTWQGVLDQLWTDAGLGTAPTLPFTPNGTPENLAYYGWYAWDAINDFLDRLACRVKLDLTTDTWSVIRLGYDGTDASRAIDQLANDRQREWDAFAGEPDYAWYPAAVRVLFPIRPEPSDGTSPLYPVDITLPTVRGVPSDSRVILHDDLTALSNPPTNLATLTTRAQERADDWVAKRRYFDSPFQVVYSDAQPFGVKRILSSLVGKVAYKDLGQGVKTEAASRPDGTLERWLPRGMPPASCDASDSGGGSGGTGNCEASGFAVDRDAIIAMATATPKRVFNYAVRKASTVTGIAGGRCECIQEQGVDTNLVPYPYPAFYDAGKGRWVGSVFIKTCCACARLEIEVIEENGDTVDDQPLMKATLYPIGGFCNGSGRTSYPMKYMCRTRNSYRFAAGTDLFCTGVAPFPCDNAFYVDIQCADCSTTGPDCQYCQEICGPPIMVVTATGFSNAYSTYNGVWTLIPESSCEWKATCGDLSVTLTLTEVAGIVYITVVFSGGGGTVTYKTLGSSTLLICYDTFTPGVQPPDDTNPDVGTVSVSSEFCDQCIQFCDWLIANHPNLNVTFGMDGIGAVACFNGKSFALAWDAVHSWWTTGSFSSPSPCTPTSTGEIRVTCIDGGRLRLVSSFTSPPTPFSCDTQVTRVVSPFLVVLTGAITATITA